MATSEQAVPSSVAGRSGEDFNCGWTVTSALAALSLKGFTEEHPKLQKLSQPDAATPTVRMAERSRKKD